MTPPKLTRQDMIRRVMVSDDFPDKKGWSYRDAEAVSESFFSVISKNGRTRSNVQVQKQSPTL